MVFDMRDAKKEIYPHFKGGEKEMIATIWEDDRIKVVHGRLEPGATTGFHKRQLLMTEVTSLYLPGGITAQPSTFGENSGPDSA